MYLVTNYLIANFSLFIFFTWCKGSGVIENYMVASVYATKGVFGQLKNASPDIACIAVSNNSHSIGPQGIIKEIPSEELAVLSFPEGAVLEINSIQFGSYK